MIRPARLVALLAPALFALAFLVPGLAVLAPLTSAQAQSLADLAENARQARAAAAPPAAAPAPSAPVVAVPGVPDVFLTVPIANISAGEVISDAMLEDRLFSAATAARYPHTASRSAIVGKTARRLLPAGSPVPGFAVTQTQIVTRGLLATVIFQEGGLSIRGVAMPLDSGSAGAMVRLKNVESGQIISGTVQPDGSVKVGG